MNWKRTSNSPIIAPSSEDMNSDEPRFIIQQNSDLSPQANRIYFYTDVSRESILSLNRQIDETTKQMKIVQLTYDLESPPPIELHICSDGGDVFAGMAAVDKIVKNSVPIHTYCEGIVASAATFLSVSGHKRFITKSSCMLIHQVSSGLWGNYKQFKEEMENLSLIMQLIKNVYVGKTKFTEEELDDILSHDLCWGSARCLEYNLVDEVI